MTEKMDHVQRVSEVVRAVGMSSIIPEIGNPSSSSPNTSLEDETDELGNRPKHFNNRRKPWDVIQLSDAVFEIHAPLEDALLVELVFIHGIVETESDRQPYLTKWSTRNDRDKCWISSWLVLGDLQRARVLTVFFDSSTRKTSSTGNIDIFQASENLIITDSLITLANVGQLSGCARKSKPGRAGHQGCCRPLRSVSDIISSVDEIVVVEEASARVISEKTARTCLFTALQSRASNHREKTLALMYSKHPTPDICSSLAAEGDSGCTWSISSHAKSERACMRFD